MVVDLNMEFIHTDELAYVLACKQQHHVGVSRSRVLVVVIMHELLSYREVVLLLKAV